METGQTPPTRAAATSRRQPLSRELILRTAIDLMDRDGVQHLTMRQLGQVLGVEAMALYHHVNGREDLLEGVVDLLVEEIRIEPGPDSPAPEGWQGLLQWVAHSVRRLALAHPQIFPLIATRHPAAPWLRPPLRSLRVVNEFLQALVTRGFTRTQAAQTYRVFTSFLLGHLLLEVATLGAETSPVEEPLDEGEAAVSNRDEDLDLDNFPALVEFRPLLQEDRTHQEFEQALEALLNRLDLEVSQ